MHKRIHGFTLVELLITLVITMSALLVIGETQIQTERVRRSSQGNQSAQFSGLMVTQLIDQGIKKSGYGLNDLTYIGEPISFFNPETATVDSEIIAPVSITQSGQNSILRVMWSTSNTNVVPVKLLNAKTATDNVTQLGNTYGMNVGDLLLYAESGKGAAVHQISAITASNEEVEHSISSTYPWNADLSASYPGGGFTTDAKVFNLGLWERQEFRIVNNALVIRRITGNGITESTVADNVVRFQALYGIDNGAGSTEADDGVPDAFVSASPTSIADWRRVVAIRFVVVTRNAEMERNVVTTSNPSWSGGSFDLSGDSNWNKYRYRTYESTVPIRNAVWTVPAS
jgi:type IV pilus assembly protein PilW